MNDAESKAVWEIMDIMRDGLERAFHQGYTIGFEHRTQVEASEVLKAFLKHETTEGK